MVILTLFILCSIVLILSLLVAVFFCCNVFACHERHQSKLTKQNWFTTRKRGIFSVYYFEEENRIQTQPPVDNIQNLARLQEVVPSRNLSHPQEVVPRQFLPPQPRLARVIHPQVHKKPSSLHSQSL